MSCTRWRSVIKERCLLQGALISVSNFGGPVIVSFTSSADLVFFWFQLVFRCVHSKRLLYCVLIVLIIVVDWDEEMTGV